jgi:hypothetical protein
MSCIARIVTFDEFRVRSRGLDESIYTPTSAALVVNDPDLTSLPKDMRAWTGMNETVDKLGGILDDTFRDLLTIC